MALSQDYLKAAGATKLPPPVQIGKPKKQTFFRIHPDFQQIYGVLEVQLEGRAGKEFYVVMPNMLATLQAEFTPATLLVGMTRQGGLFVWPLKIIAEGERANDYTRTAHEAAELATTKWIRMVANTDLAFYEVTVAEGDIPEPAWPDLAYSKILQMAFKTEGMIGSADHPIVGKLKGRI